MLSKLRLKKFQIYPLFKCLKLSVLGQFLVGGQGPRGGGHGPYGPPWVRQLLTTTHIFSKLSFWEKKPRMYLK